MKKNTGNFATAVRSEYKPWPFEPTVQENEDSAAWHNISAFRDLVRTLPNKHRVMLSTLKSISRG